MAEPISIQQLKDASLDVKSLEEVVNGDENVVVTTRLGETYPSVKGSIKKVFETGGLPATPFATKALMEASALSNGDYALVTNDTINNGLYVKTAGAWVKSSYDPVSQSKSYTDIKADSTLGKVASSFSSYASMIGSSLPTYSFAVVLSDPDNSKNGYYQKIAVGGWTYLDSSALRQIKRYEARGADAELTPYDPKSINYNTLTFTLEFKNTIYVQNRETKINLTTPTSLYLPNLGAFRLEVNIETKAIRSVTIQTPAVENWLTCAYIMRTEKGISTTSFTDYLVDGKEQDSANVAKPNYSLILSTPASLNFDFTGNKIDVTGDLWLAYDGGRKLISTQSIALSPTRDRGTAFQSVLLVNPTTSKLVLKEASGGYTVPKDHIVVGGYRESDLLFYGLDNFSVNGVPFNKSGGGSGGVRPAFGWSTNNKVNLNIPDSITPSDALNIYNITSSKMYALYDALVAAYPDYVTKTNLGNDASGTIPIYQYRFKPKLIDPQIPAVKAVLPKIMLLSLHNESINFIYVYMLMREICNSWAGNEALTSLRFGAEFVVIPVLNPWGLDNMSRTNSNSVDINRNFPVGWIPIGAVGNAAYSGTAALTESESQIGWAAMQAEKPDIYYDCHSYGGWDGLGRSVWVSIANDKTRSAATSACTKIYAQYKQKYSWIEDMNVLMHFSNANVNDGATSAKAAQSLGVIGGNLEIAWSLKNEPSGVAGHTSAVNFSSDFLGTLILQSIGVMIVQAKN